MTQKFSFLFQYLKKQRINIDQSEFNFQIQSHPYYPSLLSISDTLSFFKIDNIATRIEAAENLPTEFIALMDDKRSEQFLAFVEKKQTGYQYTNDKKTIAISNDEFNKLFGNIILLAEQREGHRPKTKNQNALYISLAVLGLIYLPSVFFNGFSFSVLSFIILAFIGACLSVEAISHELGINTNFSDAVCSFTKSTDCDAVINSTKSKVLDLFSFSEISITFFIAQLFGALFFSMSNLMHDFYNITFITLLFSLPVTIFSIYLQKFVAKKWCPICLSIILLLYVEIASILFLNDISVSINIRSIIYYSLALVISFILSANFKKLLKNNFKLKSENAEAIRFKKSYSIFKTALLTSDKVSTDTINSGNIILGNPDSKLKIIIVTSPFCSYCKGAHAIIEEILESSKDKIAVHIRFNFNADLSNEESKLVHQRLINIYFGKGENEFMKALNNWFLEKDLAKLNSFNDSVIAEINADAILAEQYDWNQKNKTNYTPVFIINDHLFPSQYNREDILSFIDDLADDESF